MITAEQEIKLCNKERAMAMEFAGLAAMFIVKLEGAGDDENQALKEIVHKTLDETFDLISLQTSAINRLKEQTL